MTFEPGRGQRPQIFHPGAEQKGQVLHGTGAGIVIGCGVHRDRGHVRRVSRSPACQIGHVGERARDRHRQRALVHQRAERIGPETAAQLVAAHAAGLGRRDIQRRGRQERRPGLQPYPGGAELHAIEQLRQIGRAGDHDAVARAQILPARVVRIMAVAGSRIEAQGHRGAAAGKVIENLRVRAGRIGMIRLLPDIPAMHRIAQRRGRPGERGETGNAGGIVAGRENGLGVERLQVDPFVAAGNHPLLEGRPLQVAFDPLAPRVVIDGREIRARLKRVRHYLDPPKSPGRAAGRASGSSETDASPPGPAL